MKKPYKEEAKICIHAVLETNPLEVAISPYPKNYYERKGVGKSWDCSNIWNSKSINWQRKQQLNILSYSFQTSNMLAHFYLIQTTFLMMSDYKTIFNMTTNWWRNAFIWLKSCGGETNVLPTGLTEEQACDLSDSDKWSVINCLAKERTK